MKKKIDTIGRFIQFKRKDCLDIKWLARTAVIFPVIACIVAEILFGAFGHYNLPAYENYYVLGGNCYSKGQSLDPLKVFEEKDLSYYTEVKTVFPQDAPPLDLNKLDATAYYALAEYCEANGYAVDEYKVADVQGNGQIVEIRKGTEPKYRLIDGKYYVKCTVIGTCLDYGREDQGETWREYESHKCEVRGCETGNSSLIGFRSTKGQEWKEWLPMLQRPLNDSQLANIYSICLTLYVCIQD